LSWASSSSLTNSQAAYPVDSVTAVAASLGLFPAALGLAKALVFFLLTRRFVRLLAPDLTGRAHSLIIIVVARAHRRITIAASAESSAACLDAQLRGTRGPSASRPVGVV
jgi:hypothetical protein